MNKLITFEGCEGAGKSTLIKNLCEYLDSNKVDYLKVREPGGLKLCEKIREIVKYSDEPISKNAELLLFSASRAQLVANFIKPMLAEGKVIVCDRFYDSSRVYQGYASGIDDKTVMQITNFATDGLVPQVTFVLDIDPQVAFLRKGGRDKGDRIEAKDLSYHQMIRKGYLQLAKKERRFVVLDATKSEQELVGIVVKKLKEEKII
ncbi:MAG: dTMP kinase [Christensenellales bacterium]